MAKWLLLLLARTVFRSGIEKELGKQAPRFFNLLRANGYPRAGDLIVIDNTPLAPAEFLGALIWSLDKTLDTEEFSDA